MNVPRFLVDEGTAFWSRQPVVQTMSVSIPVAATWLDGELTVPRGAVGLALFSGAECRDARDVKLSEALSRQGIATFVYNVARPQPPPSWAVSRDCPGQIDPAECLVEATRWLARVPLTEHLGFGYCATQRGAEAAVLAAVQLAVVVDALVLVDPQVELPLETWQRLDSPTLVVTSNDDEALSGCERIGFFKNLACPVQMKTVPSGADGFDQLASLVSHWFRQRLRAR